MSILPFLAKHRSLFFKTVLFLTLALNASMSFSEEAEPLTSTIFLNDYWQKPIPLQGEAPADFSDLEKSLHPKDCGVCHQTQYQDWTTSLHHKAMGPGLAGQAVDMLQNNLVGLQMCYYCHAPLSEQCQLPFKGTYSNLLIAFFN